MFCWLFLNCGLVVLATPQAIVRAEQTGDQSVQNALEQCQRQINSIRLRTMDQSIGLASILDDLELALDLRPLQRHRFVIPRRPATTKLGLAQLAKFFEQPSEFSAFQESVTALSNALQDSANRIESQGDLPLAFRTRSQAAGLASIVGKRSKESGWSHTPDWNSFRLVPKAPTNHPKLLWPAGSYSYLSTAHFDIASQVGTKPTEEIAEICEQTFYIWKQMFYRFWANDQTKPPNYLPSSSPRFSVAVFRDKNAYIQALRSSERNIGASTGYYDPNRNLSLFYWDGNKTLPTIVHELTHQLFFEAGASKVKLNTDSDAGYWAIEGIALYLESLSTRSIGGCAIVDVGGWDASRFQASRYRRLHDEYWIPWEEFVATTGAELRRNPDISKWYSQAAGITHLWMDGNELQRSQFIDYVTSVYAGMPDKSLLGDSNDDDVLRRAYDVFLVKGPLASTIRPFFPSRKDAVLSRCNIQSEVLLAWPVAYRSLQWLDLSFCPIDDSLFMEEQQVRQPAWSTTRLNLESTRISDRSMLALAQMKELTELDLSHCDISDEGLRSLSNHNQLKTLWLTQTKVTDQSIDALMTMPQLEQLHVQGTAITNAKWNNFILARPRLKRGSTGP